VQGNSTPNTQLNNLINRMHNFDVFRSILGIEDGEDVQLDDPSDTAVGRRVSREQGTDVPCDRARRLGGIRTEAHQRRS
jgi:hypothetical protein